MVGLIVLLRSEFLICVVAMTTEELSPVAVAKTSSLFTR